MAKNKIIYGGEVLIDLTGDTVDKASLLAGKIAHDRSGEIITGECTFDADTSDADAVDAEILEGKTAYVAGNKIEGTMTNRGGVQGIISNLTDEYAIQSGYHDGSGKVKIDSTEQDKIIGSNIKSGVTILGVEGTYEGEGGKGQSKEVEAYTDAVNVVLPDTGFDHLTQVTVDKIFYEESPNAQGGVTVSIGKKKPV